MPGPMLYQQHDRLRGAVQENAVLRAGATLVQCSHTTDRTDYRTPAPASAVAFAALSGVDVRFSHRVLQGCVQAV